MLDDSTVRGLLQSYHDQTTGEEGVPTPLMMCSSGGLGHMGTAPILSAMSAALASPDAAKKQAIEAIAVGVSTGFLAWLGSQMVTNVLGHGPVPTFAPPAVMAGPVVNGSILAAGSHLL